MANKIIKLDEQLSNKIAAGEVVERPASVVKELVENAIDANSTRIIIDIEEGGLSKIRIVDNGEGIEEQDVETAFYRHATSKIKTDKDLFQIVTLGFRGEALPSIASVSHVELNTCTGTGAGTQLMLEGGKITSKKATKSRKGTEIIVTNLFYNTPARLKYVKTIHTELGNISDIVNRQALANPTISFQLIHNGKEMLHTSGNGDTLQVVAAIYGKTIAKSMLEISGESLDYAVSGYIAKPEITRAARTYISTFINGRYIRNFALVRAIMEGFHTLLPIGRYPVAIIDIRMDPVLIDVNVHPSKLEVRLSKEEELVSIVKEEIKKKFKKEQLIPAAPIPKEKKFGATEATFQQSLLKPQEQQANVIKETGYSARTLEVDRRKTEDYDDVKQVVMTAESTEQNTITPVEEEQETGKSVNVAPSERVPVLYPIGQMHGTYILAQNDTGLYIIDQHAAQERMKYEYFRDKVGRTEKELQDLLVPLYIECTKAEALILEENAEKLKEVGVFLEPFGDNSFIVRSHPTWFTKGQEEETVHEIIQQILQDRKIDIKKLREEAAILMACKAAIKANRHLRQDEMFALLEALRKCEDPFTCPHGRPIIIHFSSYDMEKMFKRVM